MSSRWRTVAGIFLILGIIIVWAAIVASLAGLVSQWPALVQALFYMVAGVVWVFPLKPVLRWSETGRWRADQTRT